jgi:DNA-binding transcriptional MocR family regulator
LSVSSANAHRILALAERYDVRVLEDDVYCDFAPEGSPRIANLDQLGRVIYVSSFSKTVSANLRCGFIAADRELILKLTDCKGITCIATSELTERVVAELLASGEQRRQIERFRRKLAASRSRVIARLAALGFEVPHAPKAGFFIWARATRDLSTDRLAQIALDHGVVLAPGSLFCTDLGSHHWLRFNCAHCDSAEFERRMKSALLQA